MKKYIPQKLKIMHEIKKQKIEFYKLRTEEDSAWADISIDNEGSKCRVSIYSNHGHFSFAVYDPNYKDFIVGLDMNCVANMTSNNGAFDFHATIKGLKSEIAECAKNGSLNNKITHLFDEIKKLKYCNSIAVFEYQYEQTTLVKFGTGYPKLHFKVNPNFVDFWNDTWILFVNELKKELKCFNDK